MLHEKVSHARRQFCRFLFTATVLMGGGVAGGFVIGYMTSSAPWVTILCLLLMVAFIAAAAQMIHGAYARADYWKRARYEEPPPLGLPCSEYWRRK